MALPDHYFGFWCDHLVRRDRAKVAAYNHQKTLRRGRRRIAWQRFLDVLGTVVLTVLLGAGLAVGLWLIFTFVIMKR